MSYLQNKLQLRRMQYDTPLRCGEKLDANLIAHAYILHNTWARGRNVEHLPTTTSNE